MEFYEFLEKAFGRVRFLAAVGGKEFAELHLEGKDIVVEITNFPVLLEAMLIHVFKKERFTSRKLDELRKSGYRITLKYRGLEINL
jgi:hypothetical protein